MANRIKEGKTTIGAVVQIPKKVHKAIKVMAEKKQEATNKSFTINDGILLCIEVGAKKLC
jgi:hypothetical protein